MLSDIDLELDPVALKLIELAQTAGFNELPPPVSIDYGFGWEPTLSFWYRQRRIHLYWGWSSEEGAGITVEVAEHEASRSVQVGLINTYDQLWDIFVKFLKEGCAFSELPDYGWRSTATDHDKFIPHPPDRTDMSSGNITSFMEL